MNDTENKQCHAIIHSIAAVYAGIGAGLAQIPTSDSALIIPAQVHDYLAWCSI